MNAAATSSKCAFAPWPKIEPTLPCPLCNGRILPITCHCCKGSARVPMLPLGPRK